MKLLFVRLLQWWSVMFYQRHPLWLRWRREFPSVPGYYWIRAPQLSKRVAHFYSPHGQNFLVCEYLHLTSAWGQPVEYAGPIPQPAEITYHHPDVIFAGWIEAGPGDEAKLRASGVENPPSPDPPMRYNAERGCFEHCCIRGWEKFLRAHAALGFWPGCFTAIHNGKQLPREQQRAWTLQ